MRHRVAGYKLGRNTEHRIAMWRNMAVSLFTHGQITTTVTKAKSVQPFVEKLITLARRGDLASRRRVVQELGRDRIMVRHDEDENVERNRYGEVVDGPRVVKHLFEQIGPRFAERNGGYTRLVRLGTHRLGDGGDLCVLQLVGDEQGPQVSGRHSRRREKANRRMEFAARLRRERRGEAQTATAEEAGQPEQEAQAPAEQPQAPDEQPPEQAAGDEGESAQESGR